MEIVLSLNYQSWRKRRRMLDLICDIKGKNREHDGDCVKFELPKLVQTKIDVEPYFMCLKSFLSCTLYDMNNR